MKSDSFIKQSNLDTDFPLKVERTDRKKTASIKVEDGKVRVLIPRTLSPTRLEDLIRKKTPWIRRQLKIQADQKLVKLKEYVSGESFTYLGRNYRLKLINDPSKEVKLIGGKFVYGTASNLTENEKKAKTQKALHDWYVKHARERLAEKTERYAKLLGVYPSSIKVRSFKSRWGSCSINGEITYNWKIIIAPHHIVDYVVVHELCHILYQNHSESFWGALERIIPDYKECRTWLMKNTQLMGI